MKTFITCLICMGVSFYACVDVCSELKENEIADCRGENLYPDSMTLADQIIGRWEWIKHTGSYGGGQKCADKKVTVSFFTDGSYEFIENGLSLSAGNWQVVSLNEHWWIISYDGNSKYLPGWAWFCQDYVMFEPTDVLDTGYDVYKKTL